jgi:hypothetical protein
VTLDDLVHAGLDAVAPTRYASAGAEMPAETMPSEGPPRYGLMVITTAMTLGIFFGTLYGTRRKTV